MHEQRLTSGRRVRVGPWRGIPDVASVATFADLPLSARDIEELIAGLDAGGTARVITAALSPREAVPFEARGFEVLRRLVLLRRVIDAPIPAATVSLRRWRRRDLDPVLAVDNAAFDAFWSFDDVALRDAIDATPHRVLRVTRAQPLEGYALTGLAASRGYLQRLAVHPDAAGRGLGSALVVDSLRWLRWRGATEAYVNTQTDNERALALYDRHGFVPEVEDLLVLHRVLAPDAPAPVPGE